jgi:hypothetical protein
MKKPLRRCAVMNATVITPTAAAAASGVSRPRASSRPAPSSVTLAAQQPQQQDDEVSRVLRSARHRESLSIIYIS